MRRYANPTFSFSIGPQAVYEYLRDAISNRMPQYRELVIQYFTQDKDAIMKMINDRAVQIYTPMFIEDLKRVAPQIISEMASGRVSNPSSLFYGSHPIMSSPARGSKSFYGQGPMWDRPKMRHRRNLSFF